MAGGDQKIQPTGTNLSSDVDALTKLIGLFTGQKSDVITSGGTQTQQTMLSQEALNSLMRQVMESNQGLASVSSGQKAPGLYNSSTRQLLVNDLMARTSGEVAARGAPTVTTTTPKTVSTRTPSPLGSAGGLLAGAGLLLSSPSARAMGKKGLAKLLGGDGTVGDSVTPQSLAALMTSGDQVSYDPTSIGGASPFNQMLSQAMATNYSGAGLSSLGDFSSPLAGIDWTRSSESIYDTLAGLEFGPPMDLMGGVDFVGPPSDLSSAYNFFSGETMGPPADLALSGGEFGMPGFGQIMRAASGDVKGAAGSYMVSQIPVVGPYIAAIDSLTGSNLGNFVVEAPAEIVQAGGDFLSDAGDAAKGVWESVTGGCFITTATCHNRNLPDDCFELTELRRLRDEFGIRNYPAQVKEYYVIAPKIVAAINARDDASEMWDELYNTYIVPCAILAAQRRYESAHAVYVRMVGIAKAIAGINPEGSSNE